MDTSTRARARDIGSMVLAVTTVVVFAGLTAVATARLGVAMVHRTCARTAADAAALAGVEGGPAGASRLAAANGGRLVSFARSGPAVTVTVQCDDARATARASNGP
ncbi:MAG: hypothetical protein U0Q03_06650 [Acidimicrobiales bacterium]